MSEPCAQCRKVLAPGEARKVVAPLALVAAFALAMAHGGMWAREELGREYCSSCRLKVSLFALTLSLVMLGFAFVGARLWLTAPR